MPGGVEITTVEGNITFGVENIGHQIVVLQLASQVSGLCQRLASFCSLSRECHGLRVIDQYLGHRPTTVLKVMQALYGLLEVIEGGPVAALVFKNHADAVRFQCSSMRVPRLAA